MPAKAKRITDKMRLDWCERHFAELKADRFSGDERFLINRARTPQELAKVSGLYSRIDCGWHKTLRQAIDAAIRQEAKTNAR